MTGRLDKSPDTAVYRSLGERKLTKAKVLCKFGHQDEVNLSGDNQDRAEQMYSLLSPRLWSANLTIGCSHVCPRTSTEVRGRQGTLGHLGYTYSSRASITETTLVAITIYTTTGGLSSVVNLCFGEI
ncbi:hypothetical protein J6590_020135 [Homalodisca vitripennis]|nr:hypothetical protein J6590_020135 [Homalodisca vitripennis]